MFKGTTTRRHGHRTLGSALALGALLLLAPDSADAHFILREPASWMSQNLIGDPQKQGPCGTGAGGTPTGAITAFQSGQTITITINETIYHPGHYRIALAVNDRSELPAEPIVTPGASPCGSVPIQDPPVFPVLADGVLRHTRAFSGAQRVQVTLPADVTCDHCTLQVIEFMSDHELNNPGGCFYHHCADISIQRVVVGDAGAPTDAGTPTDAGSSLDAALALDAGVADAGTPAITAVDSGCDARPRGSSPAGTAASLVVGALALGLRRRRRLG